MARYLLAISVGPVQSLIAAARRTRDLSCGGQGRPWAKIPER